MPRLLIALALLASLGGLAVSIYLTLNHYAAAPLVCNLSGFSCERVLTSPYATLPLTTWPTSIAGLLFFAVSILLLSLRFFRPTPRLAQASLAWAFLGLLFVLYLVYLEIVVINAICLWCTLVHVLVVVSFLLLLYLRSAYER
jgi:uncharacterized membrane protein